MFKAPALQMDESIFISTDEWFSSSAQRLQQVTKLLESQGHICDVKTSGQITLMAIDNVLYELIPDGIRVNGMVVYGVRLRRYLM